MKKYRMHVLCHTHWDREWYQPFQEFRMRLVWQVQRLLDLLERDPDYVFHFDGSTVWIRDFLDIKPRESERLYKFIREGRILIGPWYVMPDEFLLSGESLVRDLEKGIGICRSAGAAPMPAGWVTDVFGHVSQLPQILRGFGIDTAVLHRGTGAGSREKQEMLWEGADGSRVLLIKVFPDTGYQDFLVKRFASDEDLLQYEQRKKDISLTGVLFALDGNDHTPARGDVREAAERMNRVFTDIECFPSDFFTFIAEEKQALSKIDPASLVLFRGELRNASEQGMWNELFNGIASARVNLKQRNDRCEYLLTRITEPLNAFAALYGNEDQKDFLAKAWTYLLQNHPHDSIVGCSQDQIHRDMLYRFDQSEIIADALAWESICSLPINTQAPGRERAVTVFNLSATASGPVTHFEFDAPMKEVLDKQKQGLTPALFDDDGTEIEYDVESVETGVWGKPFVKKTADAYGVREDVWVERVRHTVAARVSVPPLGYKTLSVGWSKNAPIPTSPVGSHIENEYLSFGYEDDKGFVLCDKQRKVTYEGLFQIEDCGDKGTGWDHVYPEEDTCIVCDYTVDPPEIRSRISALSGTLTAGLCLRLPRELSDGEIFRSEEPADCHVTLEFTLDSGCPYLKTVIRIHNSAKNHRMRLLFPTGCGSDRYFADTAFDVVMRDLRLPDARGWKEQPMPWGPFKNVCGIVDKKRGLAVMTKGLCEGGAEEGTDGTLAVTLFRSFSETLYGKHTRDSLMLGDLTLELAVLPTDASVSFADLLNTAAAWKLPVYSYTSAPAPGTLPETHSFARIEGGAVLSSLRAKDGGLEIRLFNPDSAGSTVRLSLPAEIAEACLTDLSGRPLKSLRPEGSSLSFEAGAKEIVTVFCRLREPRR
ncbi:MAG: hypothetical protein IK083_04490 [Abditibacteriota bacterium]|nr:hypothetical protein [Abditibacteriota bacterium]